MCVSASQLIVDRFSFQSICYDLQKLYYGNSVKKSNSLVLWSRSLDLFFKTFSKNEELFWSGFTNKISAYNNQLKKYYFNKTSHSIVLKFNKEETLEFSKCQSIYNTEMKYLLLTAIGYSIWEMTGNNLSFVNLEHNAIDNSNDNELNCSLI